MAEDIGRIPTSRELWEATYRRLTEEVAAGIDVLAALGNSDALTCERDEAVQRAEQAEREREFANRNAEKAIARLAEKQQRLAEAERLLRWALDNTNTRTTFLSVVEAFLQGANDASGEVQVPVRDEVDRGYRPSDVKESLPEAICKAILCAKETAP